MVTVLKTVVAQATVGSNPTPSATLTVHRSVYFLQSAADSIASLLPENPATTGMAQSGLTYAQAMVDSELWRIIFSQEGPHVQP